ncbi:MAG TPA: tetratricopeptide repeat protein, partial [Sedimentisphaerales bacterium]|nr:tetratricopeptide repeat protein [Sedimentisphaerales bacterium]
LRAYGVMARIFADSRRTNEAIEVYRTALERGCSQAPADEIADFRYEFATFLAKSNKMTEAHEQLGLAAQAYRDIPAGGSGSAKAHLRLGDISIIKDEFQQAAESFKKAADLDPANIECHDKLIQTYDKLGQFDNAIKAAKKALDDMSQTKQKENADKMRQNIQFLEFKKSQQKQQ